MQATRILAAAVLSFATLGVMAQEVDRTPTTFTSTRTRAAVVAEAQNARAQGASHWASGGELRDAAPAASVEAPAIALTRQDVRSQVAAARAGHQLPRDGEVM